MIEKIKKDLQAASNKSDAVFLQRFFKTAKGQYGYGDVFIGVRVPQNREIAKKYFKDITLKEVEELLHSAVHEHRMNALFILVLRYKKADVKEQEKIVKIYLRNTKYINNWDLVDLSAHYILGPWFFDKDRNKIWALAKSGDLWQERIAVITTFHFLRQKDFAMTLDLCAHFLKHEHDLIHKATGWMLREIGKRDVKPLLTFLDAHAAIMPRTMLRYSLEKLTPAQKKQYMNAGKK